MKINTWINRDKLPEDQFTHFHFKLLVFHKYRTLVINCQNSEMNLVCLSVCQCLHFEQTRCYGDASDSSAKVGCRTRRGTPLLCVPSDTQLPLTHPTPPHTHITRVYAQTNTPAHRQHWRVEHLECSDHHCLQD